MLIKILFSVVSLVAVIDEAKGLKCYFCNDDSKYGNCEGIGWSVIDDCRYGCVTYEAKIRQKPQYALYLYLFARYRRGCAGKGGCEKIHKDLLEAWDDDVPEFYCQECNEDLCNNRANHPGHKFTPPLTPPDDPNA